MGFWPGQPLPPLASDCAPQTLYGLFFLQSVPTIKASFMFNHSINVFMKLYIM